MTIWNILCFHVVVFHVSSTSQLIWSSAIYSLFFFIIYIRAAFWYSYVTMLDSRHLYEIGLIELGSILFFVIV